MSYELLRCGSASGASCSSVAVVSNTNYQTPRTMNTWYVVQARSATGQVLATSNVAGPT
jgi:hypothetical protein